MQPVTDIRVDALDDHEASEVRELVGRAASVDGVPALNEDALLELTELHQSALVRDGDRVIAYGTVDSHGHGQLVVDPAHRRQGHAARMLSELPAAAGWWAFGDLPAAHAWAERHGYVPRRTLLEMRRDLAAHPATPGESFDAYISADADAFLALNAAAFAHHPEQGALDREGLAERMAQPWFDAGDLLLARHDDGRLLGFHWTKVDPEAGAGVGEVYVLAVDPAGHGQGLGRRLLNAGLAHLADRGCTSVRLFVEADEERPVALYRSAKFEVSRTDVMYVRKEDR